MKGDAMKAMTLLLAGAALVAGCTQNEQAFVDNLVRETVSNSGQPQEVAMTKQGDNSFSGTATVRKPDGQTMRFNCTARREGDTTRYNARCLQAVDQAMLDSMENEVRQGLTSNGADVVSVELNRQDDNKMTGFAEIRDGGSTMRAPCEATRESANGAAFRWQCRPPEGQAAEAGEGTPEDAPVQQ
jgi:hypothetical protein